MNIAEYENIFKRAITDFKEDFVRLALESVQDGLALAKLRVIERGENSEGEQFSPYSDVWKEDRQERGRQVNHKDFFDTGELSASVYAEVTDESDRTVTITVKAHGQLNIDKVTGHSGREGGFIYANNSEEIELINNIFLQKQQDFFNQRLG